MKRTVRAAQWTMWAMVVCVLAACAAPTLRPAPTPASPIAIPTVQATAPARTLSPTLVPRGLSPTPRKAILTPIPPVAPLPTARPRQFDDVDARALLAALFPDVKLTPVDDVFRVNDDPTWTMWVNARVEGQFTQDTVELAAIIANDAPHLSAEQARRYAPWGSFLAIFQTRNGGLQVAQRAFLFPTAMSPLAFDARIDRAADFDHDGQNELLIITTATRLGITTTAAFLHMWNDQAFVPLWSAPVGEDNTGALNQAEYFVVASEIRLADINGDGMDEILVDGTRVDYAMDALGLPDTDREIARRSERRVYRWGGAAFVPDNARTTPLPTLATRSSP